LTTHQKNYEIIDYYFPQNKLTLSVCQTISEMVPQIRHAPNWSNTRAKHKKLPIDLALDIISIGLNYIMI